MNNKMEAHYAFLMRCVEEVASIVKIGLWVFCVCFLGFWLFRMLVEISQANDSSVVTALAIVIEKFSLDRIGLVIGNIITGAGWCQARCRNKRLTKKMGQFRHEREKDDPINDSSGLGEYGTIKGE